MIASIQAKPPEMHKTRCHIDKYSLKRNIITRMIRKEVDQMSLRGLLEIMSQRFKRTGEKNLTLILQRGKERVNSSLLRTAKI